MKYELLLTPFTGFYETKWGGLLDSAEEDAKTYLRDNYDIPEELEYSLSTTYEWNRQAEKEIGEAYAQAYTELIEEYLGIKIEVESVRVDSPKYYNFTNDRLFAKVEFELDHAGLVRKLVELSQKYRGKLLKIIEDNHTSCDGFLSFMSNDFEEWEELMMDEDGPFHPAYIDYLIAYLLHCYMNDKCRYFDESVDWTIYNDVSDWLCNAAPVFEADRDYADEWDEFQEEMKKRDQRYEMMRNQPVIPGLLDE